MNTTPAVQETQPDPSDSLIGEIRCLDINDIDLFDRNPRRSKNPVYGRIRESILANGLDQPLIVTRRPGHERFVVHAGGNTRLQILKELNAVSDDPTFSIVNCIFVEWNSESSVLLAHLRENDLRGDLTFVDKAVAICALDELLGDEDHRNGSSNRQLRDVLKEKGYGISVALISYMRYTVNVLLPAMPVALSDGLGRRQIHKIRRLQNLGREIWVSRELGDEADFDGVFSQLCRRYDSPDWQFEPLQLAIETEIAEATDSSVQVIRIEMQCRAGGRTLDAETPERQPPKPPTGPNKLDADETSSNRNPGRATQVSIQLPRDFSQSTTQKSPAAESTTADEFHDLRCRSYSAAVSLARRYGVAEAIVPMPHDGFGYMVASLPAADVIDNLDDELRSTVCTMWWQLVSFSETLSAPEAVIKRYVDSDSELQPIIRYGNTQPLIDRVWSIDPGRFAERFWNRLGDNDWQDWLSLANSYRQLQRVSVQQEQPLWECRR